LSAIGTLDESNASLRLLITLYQTDKPLILSELYREMHSRYKIGRRAVETAIQTCIELNLVKRETKRIGKNPMPSIFHELTPKGKKIAEICIKLERSLR